MEKKRNKEEKKKENKKYGLFYLMCVLSKVCLMLTFGNFSYLLFVVAQHSTKTQTQGVRTEKRKEKKREENMKNIGEKKQPRIQ